MYLYEIKASLFDKFLREQATDIDSRVRDTAQQVRRGVGMGAGETDDLTAGTFGQAPDPTAGQSPLQQQQPEGEEQDLLQPDLAPGEAPTDDELDELMMKSVDSAVISAVKGMPYTDSYRHEETSKIHPYRIMQMTADELNQLRTMARNKLNMETFSGRLGVYDSPDVKFFQDLVSFVDKVIETKKKVTKGHNDKKQGKTANFDQRKGSGNEKE